jgi:hypothetical protein
MIENAKAIELHLDRGRLPVDGGGAGVVVDAAGLSA